MGHGPQRGRDAMLKGASMTPCYTYTYTICIDHGFIYSEWGPEVVSLTMGDLAKNN